MKLSDVKIGDKFILNNRMYLRINMNPSVMFKNVQLPYNTVAAINLSTYKVMCLNGDYEVEVEYDNVFI